MDFHAMLQALGNGGSLGGSVMAGFQQPQPAPYTQAPVPSMGQPMYQNALGQPPQMPQPAPSGTPYQQGYQTAQAQQAPQQAPGMANAPGMPGAQPQHGVFSQLVRAFAGGAG